MWLRFNLLILFSFFLFLSSAFAEPVVPVYGNLYYNYFAKPPPGDPWSQRINEWQGRIHQHKSDRLADVSAGTAQAQKPQGDLEKQYSSFDTFLLQRLPPEYKRKVIGEFASWLQEIEKTE